MYPLFGSAGATATRALVAAARIRAATTVTGAAFLRGSLKHTPRPAAAAATSGALRARWLGQSRSASGDRDVRREVPFDVDPVDIDTEVKNLLYNHPEPTDLPEDPEGQVLSVLVEDEPGVLSRVASLLSGRGHNIKSLSVSPTNLRGISRMTITVLATVPETRKIVRQIEAVEETLAVLQSSRVDSVHREVILLKMSTEFPEVSDRTERAKQIHRKRSELMELTELFKGEIVDVGSKHVTIQLTAWPKRIDALIELARPYGIVEVARSGVVAMPRATVAQKAAGMVEDETLTLAQLPPS